ncbi:phosphodiester glycosidase family protein [Janthinobacterium sp. SUN176]|uniref:phosphodiester glycosidase family protein n=1 Tax=Janthinobacterium sp. SUN176 TaxID=3014788 RepID=UPI0027124790|nr:phosphodiester glycosidase family protein [Janthinobacterium sp. SUN176]MDO8071346.1 phosphodiester glycosidase family protein [Janthinobacterium sp. SUN176]
MSHFKTQLVYLCISLLASIAMPSANAGSPLQYKKVIPGIETSDATFAANKDIVNSVALHIIRINPALVRISVVDVRFLSNPHDRNSMQIAFSLREVMRLIAPVAAINGGYTRSLIKPIPTGLILSEGKHTSTIINNSTKIRGVICIGRDGRVTIDEISAIDTADCLSAIQSGPIVIEKNGENGIRKSQQSVKAMRSLVGIDQKGWVYLIQTTSASLFDLAEILRPGGALDTGLTAALNLDGDVDSGMVIKEENGTRIFGNVDAVIPSALVIHALPYRGKRLK